MSDHRHEGTVTGEAPPHFGQSQIHRRCDNPSCRAVMEWPEQQRGRPPRFCSDRCRQRAPMDLARLEAQLRELNALLSQELSYRQRRELNSRRTRVEWHLSAFPQSMVSPTARHSTSTPDAE